MQNPLNCPSCRLQVYEHTRYCPQCGKQVGRQAGSELRLVAAMFLCILSLAIGGLGFCVGMLLAPDSKPWNWSDWAFLGFIVAMLFGAGVYCVLSEKQT